MLSIARQLHLAFKAKKANEMYDILAEQLLKAIRKYDPDYKEKVKEIVEVIDEKYRRLAAHRTRRRRTHRVYILCSDVVPLLPPAVDQPYHV